MLRAMGGAVIATHHRQSPRDAKKRLAASRDTEGAAPLVDGGVKESTCAPPAAAPLPSPLPLSPPRKTRFPSTMEKPADAAADARMAGVASAPPPLSHCAGGAEMKPLMPRAHAVCIVAPMSTLTAGGRERVPFATAAAREGVARMFLRSASMPDAKERAERTLSRAENTRMRPRTRAATNASVAGIVRAYVRPRRHDG